MLASICHALVARPHIYRLELASPFNTDGRLSAASVRGDNPFR
jgi:hypothetical protein